MNDNEFDKTLSDFSNMVSSRKYESDNSIENKNFLIKELLPLLGISEKELKNGNEDLMKSKIRKLKLKIVNS